MNYHPPYRGDIIIEDMTVIRHMIFFASNIQLSSELSNYTKGKMCGGF